MKKPNIRVSFLLITALLLGGCAAAARILYPVQLDPLKSKPGIYKLDPTHANIIFAVDHLGFSLHHGRFNQIAGSLELNTEAPEKSRVFIEVAAASIDTNNVELDQMLRDREMFDTANFPIITFESFKLTRIGEKAAAIEGYLTIKGVRKPLAIEATFVGSGINPLTGLATVGFSGKGRFKRSDFGLDRWLPFVGDEVNLILEAEFGRIEG